VWVCGRKHVKKKKEMNQCAMLLLLCCADVN